MFFQVPVLPEASLRAGRVKAVAMAIKGMAVHKELFPDELIDRYRTNALKPGALTAMINYYRANLRGLMDGRLMPPIATPTLLIWGERDAAFGPELAEALDEYVPDLTSVRLKQASHWVQQDAPVAVNEAITSWLARRRIDAG